MNDPARITSIERMTPDEVAKRLRVSRATVYRLVADGELPAFRAGRRGLRILCDAIEAYEARQKVHVPESAAPTGTDGTAGAGHTSQASAGSRSARATTRRANVGSERPYSVSDLRREWGMRPSRRSP